MIASKDVFFREVLARLFDDIMIFPTIVSFATIMDVWAGVSALQASRLAASETPRLQRPTPMTATSGSGVPHRAARLFQALVRWSSGR
jgi:hypothetical protein